MAVGVHETGAVRLVLPAGEDELPGDRLAGGAVPLLPFLGAVWLPVGVQIFAAALVFGQVPEPSPAELWEQLTAELAAAGFSYDGHGDQMREHGQAYGVGKGAGPSKLELSSTQSRVDVLQ